MPHPWPAGPCGWRERGVTLLVVLVLLLILGLSAAAVLRDSASGERFAHNLRQQQLAQQQAELALRHCEAELRKPDGSEAGLAPGAFLRDPMLAQAGLARIAWDAAPAWRLGANWTGMGGPASGRVVLPQELADLPLSGSAPGRRPECMVELQELADGALVHVITARGFSPAYPTAAGVDPTALPASGAVVWLQSMVLLGELVPAGDASARRPIVDRLWRRILQPPLP
ncbi:hypothetical protein AZ34_07350 [Hylemonella gracilis str. Niagara R]|uniref:Type 4 fimbrial biogenesis protein PilX N-terminal domain-containing protein n=1 Tax=Hylemonella gracilis str. Niagara R TaxID=1458275 RepID=A0A016XGD2_9BURK|nr:hypothetical protein AZ34_07350 [Hylemonella gracilis str. Niagara R]